MLGTSPGRDGREVGRLVPHRGHCARHCTATLEKFVSDVSRLRSPVSRLLLHLRMFRGRYAVYLTGCLLFSVGASFFIHSDLGTDPLDVFALWGCLIMSRSPSASLRPWSPRSVLPSGHCGTAGGRFCRRS